MGEANRKMDHFVAQNIGTVEEVKAAADAHFGRDVPVNVIENSLRRVKSKK